ncbi:hypothetical protein OCU04_004410 [Sclerotinia nivalis]|uniref:Uncharacterized protein n=1 Tax=Sclerotinia nivalis TaxID=352851 RepID=A0A9X0AQR0_9HELO|nr:hypothetical protein OCU04_004410 [Sclerotinia nivalis]
MPIQSPIKPEDSEGLRSKILATKPGQEGIIIADVKSHLGESGYATYEQATIDTRDVALTGKCIVFLIRGTFEVGEENIHRNGLAYPVEDEGSIRLQQKTVVVIIKKN